MSEFAITGKQRQELDAIPSHGMHGGPLVSVVFHYEDGSLMCLGSDNPFIKSITQKPEGKPLNQ